jgi:hypothetical protein
MRCAVPPCPSTRKRFLWRSWRGTGHYETETPTVLGPS